MSNNDINLYYYKRSQSADNQKIVKWFQITAVGCLAIVLVSSIAIAFLKTTSKETSLRDEEQQLLLELKKQDKKTGSLFLISERLKGIINIVNSRFDFNTVLSYILSEIPSEVAIDSLSIDDKKLIVSLSSPSLFSIEQSLNQLTKLINTSKRFRKIDMDEFNVDYHYGSYTVLLTAEIL